MMRVNTIIVVIKTMIHWDFVVVQKSFHAEVIGFIGCTFGIGISVVDQIKCGVFTTHDQWQGNSGCWGVEVVVVWRN